MMTPEAFQEIEETSSFSSLTSCRFYRVYANRESLLKNRSFFSFPKSVWFNGYLNRGEGVPPTLFPWAAILSLKIDLHVSRSPRRPRLMIVYYLGSRTLCFSEDLPRLIWVWGRGWLERRNRFFTNFGWWFQFSYLSSWIRQWRCPWTTCRRWLGRPRWMHGVLLVT